MSVTHINIRPGAHGKLHDASPDCWCRPDVRTFKSGGRERFAEPVTVVDHRDGVHASVADDLTRGGVLSHETPPHILGARKVS